MKKRLFAICFVALACTTVGLAAEDAKVFGKPVRVKGTLDRMMAVCLDGDRLYAGGGMDFYVFDVSSPLMPKMLGKVSGLGSVRQIAVRNGMAYVSARENALWIVDATDPSQPRIRSRFDCCELATGVDVAGDVVFLGQRQNGVEFIDVSNPDLPAHIAMRKTDESQSVKYRNGYLYSGDWGSGKVTVFDAHDMRNIRQVAYEDLHGYGDGVWLKGNYLYAATGHHSKHRDVSTLPMKGVDTAELRRFGGGGPGAGCGHGLDIFDVSNPAAPKHVGRADYPPMYVRGLDMWTVRTSASSDMVFCAATHNGLFAVDCTDPAHPVVADRWTLPEPGHAERPSYCIGSVAVGNGCVYAAVFGGGLVVLPARGAATETFDQGAAPVHASYREDYPTDTNEFWVWKSDRPGQARGVAVMGDVVYAACGDAGLHVLKIRPEGGFAKIGELAGHPRVFDVSTDGRRLYTAEGPDGFGFYEMDGPVDFREVGRLPNIDGLGKSWAFWTYAIGGDWVVLSARLGGDRLYDISDIANPRYILNVAGCPGWNKYTMDKPIGGGRYLAHNGANHWIDWIDLQARPKPVVAHTKVNRTSLSCGVCRFSEDLAILTRGVEYVLLRPNEMDPADGTQWTGRKFPGPRMNGIPRSDGRLVVKTSRITREVGLYDFTNPEKPIFLKHWKVSGNPDLAAFHNGKVIIPCGHQGVLMQK